MHMKNIRAWPKPGPFNRPEFSATTIAGCTLRRGVRLSYELLAGPVIVLPAEGSAGVPAAGFTAMWQEIEDADAVRVAVEVEADGTSIKVDLLETLRALMGPPGFCGRACCTRWT